MNKNVFIFFIFFLIALFLLKYDSLTGFTVYDNETNDNQTQNNNQSNDDSDDNETEDQDDEDKGNYGNLIGNLVYTIKDSGNIISSESAPNQELYFSESSINDFNLVKEYDKKYKGDLTIDADSSSSKCSSQSYETKRMYYDADSSGNKNGNEFYIYQITTDSNGCFGARLPPGNYDIYS